MTTIRKIPMIPVSIWMLEMKYARIYGKLSLLTKLTGIRANLSKVKWKLKHVNGSGGIPVLFGASNYSNTIFSGSLPGTNESCISSFFLDTTVLLFP